MMIFLNTLAQTYSKYMKKLCILFFIMIILLGCKKKSKIPEENVDSVLLTNATLLIEPKATTGNRYSVSASVNDAAYGRVEVVAEKDIFYGSSVTLKATENDSSFMFWVENGRIVSKDKTFAFLVTERHNLTAYFLPNNKYASIFIDLNKGLIDFIINDNKVNSTNNDPFKSFGFKFDKFKVIDENENYTYFQSSYLKSKFDYQVTVKNGIIKETNKGVSEVSYGSTITLYSDNNQFSYWMINNQIVSYSNEYKLTIYKDIEVEAVINKSEVKKLLVYNQEASFEDNQLMFVGQVHNPNNLRIVEVGVIFIFGDKYLNLPIQSWDEINKQPINNISVNNEFALYMNLKKGQTINVCTYVKTNNGTDVLPVYVDHYSNIIAFQNN